MGLKCEKCDGEHEVTKYCLECKKVFCHEVKTFKIKQTAPKLFDVVSNCPNCGSDKVVPATSELTGDDSAKES